MKQKLFSIFCCLLLSASMVTQAQLLDDIRPATRNDNQQRSQTNALINISQDKALNSINGQNKAPSAVMDGSYLAVKFNTANHVINSSIYNYSTDYWWWNQNQFVKIEAYTNPAQFTYNYVVLYFWVKTYTSYNGKTGPNAKTYSVVTPGLTDDGYYAYWKPSASAVDNSVINYKTDNVYGIMGQCGVSSYLGKRTSGGSVTVISDLTGASVVVAEGKGGNFYIRVVSGSTGSDMITIGEPKPYYNVNVSKSPNITATITGTGSFVEGSSTTLTVSNVQSGYHFVRWVDGGTTSTSTSYTISNIQSAHNVTAEFAVNATNVTITLNNQSATTAGTASVTATLNANTNLNGNPAITVPTKTNRNFGGYYTGTKGSGVQIINASGSFIAQAGGDNTYLDASKNWKYGSNITLYAYWYNVISTAVSGNGTVSGAGNYSENSSTNLNATPANSNYYLYDWQRDGVSLGERTNPLVKSVTADVTYTAVFREKEWTLTVESDDPSLGTASGSGKYYNGENTTLVATPANSFTSFVKWQKNGVDIAGGASLNVTVNANDTYTAFFAGRNIIEVDIDASYTDRMAIYSLRGYSSDNKYYVDAAFNTSNHALSSVDGITYNGSSMSFTNKVVEGIDQPCGNRMITHLYCYNATGDVYCFNIHWHSPWDDDKNDTYPNDRIITNNIQIGYEAALGAVYVYGYNTWEDFTSMSSRAFGLYFVTGQRCSDDIKLPVGTYPINCSGEPGTVMSYQPGVGEIDLYGGWAKTQGIVFGYYLLDTGMVTVSKSGTTYTITVNAKNSYGNVLNSTITFSESDLSSTTIPNYTLNVNTDGHGTASVKRYDCNGDLNTVSNSGSYKQGSYFRLEATANAGYAFDYWTMTGSSEHFDENPIELEGLYDNATVTAHFKSAYALAWDANGGELEGTAGEDYTSAGYYAAGTSITAPTATRTGYTFTGWSPAFTGTMPSANTTYTAQWNAKLSSITLEDNRENSFYNTFKSTYNGESGLIVTYARQFTQGRWSTLCLPFNVNKAMFSSLNFGSRIYEFKYATGNANDGSGVNLYFSIAKSIEAGKGYIVNADATLAARTSFTFSGVTMDLSADNGAELNSVDAYDNLTGNSSEGNIELVGTLRKGTLKGTAADNRYMGLKENKIYYPNITTGSTILAYRGIFRSIDGTLNAERIRIIVDGEEKAELEVINGELQDVQETKKFIENGVLYIERNGIIYDATGRKVE